MKAHAEVALPMRYLVGLILAFAAPLGATDFGYALRTGYIHSDNVGREASGEVSSGIGVVGAEFDASKSAGRLRYDVGGNGAYEEIFDSNFSSTFIGNANASATLVILPDVFDWKARASFNQIRTDLSRGFVPANREDVTTISTGPRLSAHFGSDGFAALEGHYQFNDFSERDSDSTTIGGGFEIGRSSSRDTHLALAVTHEDVHYTSETASGAVDFIRREAFLKWKDTGARTVLQMEAGLSEVTGSGFDTSGPLYRFNILRRLTPFLSGLLVASRTFPTSPSSFSPSSFILTNGASGDIVALDSTIVTAAARRLKTFGGGLLLSRPRTSLDFTYCRRQEHEVASPSSDRTFDELLANFSHQLTSRVYGNLFGDYLRDTESNTSVRARERVLGISLGTKLSRSLSLEGALQQHDRKGDNASGEYDEVRGGIYFFYGAGSLSALPERRRAAAEGCG